MKPGSERIKCCLSHLQKEHDCFICLKPPAWTGQVYRFRSRLFVLSTGYSRTNADVSSSSPCSPLQADVALFASFVFDCQAPPDLLSFITNTMNTPAKV